MRLYRWFHRAFPLQPWLTVLGGAPSAALLLPALLLMLLVRCSADRVSGPEDGGPGVAPVTAWTAMQSPCTLALNGVWGTTPTQVFAVGDGGTILRGVP